MSMNEVNAFIEGVTKKRETSINDNLFIGRTNAIMISQAVWGAPEFPDESPTIDLTNIGKPKSKEDYIRDIIKFQMSVHKDIQKLKGGA